MELRAILTKAVQMGASDIHLKSGVVPIIRRHGELKPLDSESPRLKPSDVEALVQSILSPKLQAQLAAQCELDIGLGVNAVGRFRINIFKQRGSFQMVIRVIPDSVPKLMDLNLPPVIEKMTGFERGLILVTGVTGSGKSTTLAAIIDHINETQKRHIITIEDPIEYFMRDRRSIVTQRELGADTLTFSKALRAALRQDPDVIMIGEMRDRETIDTALVAAETGHLVLSTLHTSDAVETINRIMAMYEPHKQLQVRMQLASTLKAIVSQRLAKRADGQGLIPAVEIMLNTSRIREMIIKAERTNDMLAAIEEGNLGYGMQSFDQCLMAMLSKQLITQEEALQLSSSPEDFELRFRGVRSSDGGRFKDHDKLMGNTFWRELPTLEVETLHGVNQGNNSPPQNPGAKKKTG